MLKEPLVCIRPGIELCIYLLLKLSCKYEGERCYNFNIDKYQDTVHKKQTFNITARSLRENMLALTPGKRNEVATMAAQFIQIAISTFICENIILT